MFPLAMAKPGYDNTLLLIEEALRRGFEAYHFIPEDVSMNTQGRLFTRARLMAFDGENIVQKDDMVLDLHDLDVLFFRQDPPFDMAYITNTYLLERLEHDVLMVNHPRWIRDMPDKLSIFDCQDYMAPTLISRDRDHLAAFLSEQNNDVVAKPLYGFKGHGIERVSSIDAIMSMIDTMAEPIMLQPFLPQIREGNKRIVLFNGEIVGALKSVPEEDFRIYRDSQDLAYEPTEDELKLCRDIAPLLVERGLIFVGLDLIGPYLTEINVGSVGSLQRLNAIYKDHFETKLFDCILPLVKS